MSGVGGEGTEGSRGGGGVQQMTGGWGDHKPMDIGADGQRERYPESDLIRVSDFLEMIAFRKTWTSHVSLTSIVEYPVKYGTVLVASNETAVYVV